MKKYLIAAEILGKLKFVAEFTATAGKKYLVTKWTGCEHKAIQYDRAKEASEIISDIKCFQNRDFKVHPCTIINPLNHKKTHISDSSLK